MMYNLLSFEDLPSDNQNLTFNLLESELKNKIGIEQFNKDILRSLGLYKNNEYNNAAAILSDKNSIVGSRIDIVRFGENESILLDRITEKGKSLLWQYKKAIEFFEKWYPDYEVVTGFYRESRIQIPKESYREAVANLCVHRRFDMKAATRIAGYEDRIELTSPGGLPEGLSEKEYLNGRLSVLRNERVAEIFHRLGIIEKFATGIKKIKREYANYKEDPHFSVNENSITVILPKIIYDENTNKDKNISLDETVLRLLRGNKSMSRVELEEKTGIKGRTLRNILKELMDKKLVKRIGAGPSTKYTLH